MAEKTSTLWGINHSKAFGFSILIKSLGKVKPLILFLS